MLVYANAVVGTDVTCSLKGPLGVEPRIGSAKREERGGEREGTREKEGGKGEEEGGRERKDGKINILG